MHDRQTALHATHTRLGARFTSFAGWQMPVQYPAGTISEHLATRNSAGLFDISHMGQFRVHGRDAAAWLAGMLSADISRLAEGSATYALLCRPDGGVIDDLFVYRTGPETFLVVANAARRAEDQEWLRSHLPDTGVDLQDESDSTAMLAIQGPRAVAIAAGVLGAGLSDLPRFGITRCDWNGTPVEAARTGYTGEDGLELFLGDRHAAQLWQALIDAAAEHGIHLQPCGLAARDTLRLEAGFALYGHELSTELTPVEARLTWACELDHDFIGRDAIRARKETGSSRDLRRLVMADAGVPREGYPVQDAEGKEVGIVVSGGRAPSLAGFIANAYVDSRVPRDATLRVVIRGRAAEARQHRGPVYRPAYPRFASIDELLDHSGEFRARHIGPRGREIRDMLKVIGRGSLDELISETVPADIRRHHPLTIPDARSEEEMLTRLRSIAARNTPMRSLIGRGYADTITPPVIRRDILENPGWYTQYTPYQAEIAQGRLEALLNYQTMVTDLTAMDIANASMLDEVSACAEAMTMAIRSAGRGNGPRRVLVDDCLHPQTIEHLITRAEPLGIDLVVAPVDEWSLGDTTVAGILQYPDTTGQVRDLRTCTDALHAAGALAVVASDLLALTLLSPPGEWGADIVVGSSQRFGVPLGFGGPHAAFLATREKLKRLMPGRLVGVSRDRSGRPAMRLALQTREQHIRRDKATSNICTAQVLLAIMASMYAVYHGPDGLTRIARRISVMAHALRDLLREAGFPVREGPIFDTVSFHADADAQQRLRAATEDAGFNLRFDPDGLTGITLDERTTATELAALLSAMGVEREERDIRAAAARTAHRPYPGLERRSPFLSGQVFHRYRSETALRRYITSLQQRDLSLAHAMIPLGSCTMKLNPTAAMEPISWPEFASIHPYAPDAQTGGYRMLAEELSGWLVDITGLHGCSLQPNSGAQGEYTGLMAIRSWHLSRGDRQRRVCLVPDSAHGTNPASATIAGMEVVVVRSAENGDIDLDDLRQRAAEHAESLAAMMITYPSTHGVFEAGIRSAIEIVHEHGGQVYMDGANMNAQVGLTSPGDIGADVCHLNLHKTFAIPHGGGGPGVGPVLTAEHLTPFLPGRPGEPGPTGVVVGAPLGSAGVLPISYAYIGMMGSSGLKRASEVAILNANYIAARLRPWVPIAYTGPSGLVAHECILDLRRVEKETGVTVEDIAKRLTDYGFHAPTMSWPVHGSLMVEPTESENRDELDRFCDAMIAIMEEVDEIAGGSIAYADSPLANAPHTLRDLSGDWDRAYSREQAAYPAPWVRENKFWPAVGRVDNVHGDRNLVCSCAPLEAYRETLHG